MRVHKEGKNQSRSNQARATWRIATKEESIEVHGAEDDSGTNVEQCQVGQNLINKWCTPLLCGTLDFLNPTKVVMRAQSFRVTIVQAAAACTAAAASFQPILGGRGRELVDLALCPDNVVGDMQGGAAQ